MLSFRLDVVSSTSIAWGSATWDCVWAQHFLIVPQSWLQQQSISNMAVKLPPLWVQPTYMQACHGKTYENPWYSLAGPKLGPCTILSSMTQMLSHIHRTREPYQESPSTPIIPVDSPDRGAYGSSAVGMVDLVAPVSTKKANHFDIILAFIKGPVYLPWLLVPGSKLHLVEVVVNN